MEKGIELTFHINYFSSELALLKIRQRCREMGPGQREQGADICGAIKIMGN